jgi:hypothetical protein
VFAGSELDPAASLRKKDKLCKKLDALEPADAPDVPLAEKLQAALNNNALGVLKGDDTDPVEQTKQALAQWLRIGPTPGAEGDALDKRFADACARAGVDMPPDPEPDPEPEPEPEPIAAAPEPEPEPEPELISAAPVAVAPPPDPVPVPVPAPDPDPVPVSVPDPDPVPADADVDDGWD